MQDDGKHREAAFIIADNSSSSLLFEAFIMELFGFGGELWLCCLLHVSSL
jgi:hypothetical protein